MWIEKRKDRLIACERFYDEMTGKNVKISVTILKDTAQERKKATKLLAEKWAKQHEQITNLTLSQIGELYFAEKKKIVKEQTYKRDKGQFKIVQKLVGDVLIDKITARYIKSKLEHSGKPNVTLNSYVKILKIVLRWAFNEEYTQNAVYAKIKKFEDKSVKEKIKDKFLESDELTTLISGMKCENWKMLTQFLSLTGMRIGEAIALENSDVDFTNKTISINKTYIPGLQRIGTPKTRDSIRTIPMQKELFQLANKIKMYSAKTKMVMGERNDIFFCSPYGKYITYDIYEKYLRENSMRLISRSVTAHVLRHTFTSIYAEKGLSLDQIARQLGHSSSKITKDIYYHVTENQKQKDAHQIEEIQIFAH